MSDQLEVIFSRKYLIQWLYVGSALLVLISSVVWWTMVYENPYNVYWGMLENSLKTTSVTKHITEEANGTNLDQYIEFKFGTTNLAYAKTSVKDSTGTVTTENMGTLQNDYVRYISVQAAKKSTTGKQPDFSKLLGKWAKSAAMNTNSSSTPPFFTQTMLGFQGGNLVPMANMPGANRATLLAQLHNNTIFQVSFNDVKRQKINGRPVYTYAVNVQPVAYVAFEKLFAQDLAIKAMENVDPNTYHGNAAIKVAFQVDAWSHQLVGISYPGTQHMETYASHGVITNMTEPKDTISAQTFQAILRSLQ